MRTHVIIVAAAVAAIVQIGFTQDRSKKAGKIDWLRDWQPEIVYS